MQPGCWFLGMETPGVRQSGWCYLFDIFAFFSVLNSYVLLMYGERKQAERG